MRSSPTALLLLLLIGALLVGCGDDDRYVGYTRGEAEREIAEINARPASGERCPARVVKRVRCRRVPDAWRCTTELMDGDTITEDIAEGAPRTSTIC
ncbi:hypothetical protein [Paraconexibacter sp. AEG42_29]|uniref:hypothetical protein n=1 Tax=Paraconexibacter sp. AEG42_29 TaxID=2997339 RepID=UPI00339D771C